MRLVNNTTTSTIDVTRNTDATGAALFTGAPAGSNYQIFVSEAGYSSDQTYQATTSLPNPTTLPVSVLESDVSTMNFQVDRLSDLDIYVVDNQVLDFYEDDFSSTSTLALTSNAHATSGEVILTDTLGVYAGSGYVLTNLISPTPLDSWGFLELSKSEPSNTGVLVHFYSSTSLSDIISDSDLPGNSAGFNSEYIDLSSLSTASYPDLVVGFHLSTSDTSATPEVYIMKLHYIESQNYRAGIDLDIRGAKSIGTLADFSPVYKYNLSTTTNASGRVALRDIEWDTYTITLGAGLTIADACPFSPTAILPNTNSDLYLSAAVASANSLRVDVRSGDGKPIIGADVDLELGASSWSDVTSWCGQAYFGSLADDPNYILTVSAPGYTTQVIDPITITETSVVRSVVLSP